MIYIGTSGYSYDDWKGHFYPEKISQKDMLPYYARRFKTVEINSTYYAIPSPAAFSAMVTKTPDDFKFAVKAHKDITHTEDTPGETMQMFLRAIQPLSDAGKLGCILAQYPWGFKKTAENIGRIKMLKDSLQDLPTIIEFRNAEWVGNDTLDLLKSLGLGFCSVDEPRLKGLMPPVTAATSNVGYVRFHGRNTEKWWKHDNAWERYDYLYKEEELAEWVPEVKALAENTTDTYIYFNNHYKGKSAANAGMIADMLKVSLPEIRPEQPSLW